MDENFLFRTIKSTPFFYELSYREFTEIVREIKVHRLKNDTAIIHEKEKGDSLFFVLSGALRATMKNPKNSKNILLSRLGVGNFFGEFSFLTGRLRNATVSTITESELIEIPKGIYKKVAMKYPSVRRFLVDLCIQHERQTAEVIKSQKIERRRYPRFKVKGKIKFQEYKTEGESKVIRLGNGVLIDISEGGISFKIFKDENNEDNQDMYGKECKAKIEVEGFPAPIKALGKVVSFEKGIENRKLADYFVARMKFLKIDRNDKNAFRDLLDSQTNFKIARKL